MQLVNSNGMAITKTRLGKKYGEEFSELKTYSRDFVNKKGYIILGFGRINLNIKDLYF